MNYYPVLVLQLQDAKKRHEEDQSSLESVEENNRKFQRELEAVTNKLDELKSNTDKLEKTKKRLQAEVSKEKIASQNEMLQTKGNFLSKQRENK